MVDHHPLCILLESLCIMVIFVIPYSKEFSIENCFLSSVMFSWFDWCSFCLCFYTQGIANSIAFSLGLAMTLALLGIGASFAGKTYGQIGKGLPLAASSLAILMGLNLLEVSLQPVILIYQAVWSGFCILIFENLRYFVSVI